MTIRFGAPLLALLLSSEAHTSEHHQELELAELVRSSGAIVIAVPAEPSVKKTPVPFPGRRNVTKEPMPEYVRTQQRYVVREVLVNRSGATLAVGATIEVDTAQYETKKTVFEKYYFEGVSKIPIYRTYYATTQPPTSSAQKIIFLSKRGDGWEFAADGAIEHLGVRDRVERELKKAPAEPTVDEPPRRQ